MHTLKLMPWQLSIVQLPLGDAYGWATAGAFYVISKTPEELSIVCETALVPKGAAQQNGLRALRIEGILDFSLVGILAKLSTVLANADISIFAISTYNTDYILVKEMDAAQAVKTLRNNDYVVLTK